MKNIVRYFGFFKGLIFGLILLFSYSDLFACTALDPGEARIVQRVDHSWDGVSTTVRVSNTHGNGSFKIKLAKPIDLIAPIDGATLYEVNAQGPFVPPHFDDYYPQLSPGAIKALQDGISIPTETARYALVFESVDDRVTFLRRLGSRHKVLLDNGMLQQNEGVILPIVLFDSTPTCFHHAPLLGLESSSITI